MLLPVAVSLLCNSWLMAQWLSWEDVWRKWREMLPSSCLTTCQQLQSPSFLLSRQSVTVHSYRYSFSVTWSISAKFVIIWYHSVLAWVMRMRLVKVSHQSRVKIKDATNEASFMVNMSATPVCMIFLFNSAFTSLRYDTIEEFSVDSKAEYSALSSTRSQKKRTKTNGGAPLKQYRSRSVKAVRRNKSDYGGKNLWTR